MVANQDLFDLFGDIVKSLPYLSVVIPFRNDDYSENALEKFNFLLKLLISQLEENRIAAEIIIVDWNSPYSEHPLINEIRIKQNSEYVSVVVYGGCHAEELVGRAIPDVRDKVTIITKFSARHSRAADVIVVAERRLKRLERTTSMCICRIGPTHKFPLNVY